MSQRGFVIPVTLILYAVAALAVIGGAVYVKHQAETWCNAACTEARAERDKLADEKAAALKREAAIAVLYGQQVAATQAAETKRDEVRHETFTPIRQRAGALVGVRVPADAVRVLADATRAANAAGTAASPQEAAAPPAAPADSLIEWFVGVAEIHAECRDRVAAWERFYSGLRAAQQETAHEQIH